MTAQIIDVHTSHGTMPVHLSRPPGSGGSALVIIYMDAPGVREDLHAAARRLNDDGFTTALPDLYYRLEDAARPDPERLRAGDEQEFKRLGEAAASVHDDVVLADTRSLLDRLDAEGVDTAAWACVGFCMGGCFGLRAASEFGDAVIAASLLHPSRLVTDSPDAPYRRLASVSAELYLAFGENDHVTPVSTIAPLREQLQQHGIAHRIEVLPGADHGFTQPSMPAYDRTAAEAAWAGTLELLRRRLPTTS